jgi:hypothetical protein
MSCLMLDVQPRASVRIEGLGPSGSVDDNKWMHCDDSRRANVALDSVVNGT